MVSKKKLLDDDTDSDTDKQKKSTLIPPNPTTPNPTSPAAMPEGKPIAEVKGEQITDKEGKENKSTAPPPPKPSSSKIQKGKTVAEIQDEQINPLNLPNKPSDTKTKIISRMQIKDLKPSLQTCPLSDEDRIKLKKESPFYVNMKELCTPEKLLRLEAEKIPATIPFIPEPLIYQRKVFRAYGNCKVFIQPLWYHFKKSEKFVTINFQSFARCDLLVKMIITNTRNFQIRPKIKELKPLEKGTFELYYSKKKLQKSPYNMFSISWLSKERWQELKKMKVDFFTMAAHEGGMIFIPIICDDYDNENTIENEEDTTNRKNKSQSKASTIGSTKDESKKLSARFASISSKPKPPSRNKIKAIIPSEVSSCSRATQESRKQKNVKSLL